MASSAAPAAPAPLSVSALYKARQKRDDSAIEAKRKAALGALPAVSTLLLDHVNAGVRQVFANQRALEAEARTMQAHSARFVRQTQQWLQLVDTFNDALKELGDFESWATAIDKDLGQIANLLEDVLTKGPATPQKQPHGPPPQTPPASAQPAPPAPQPIPAGSDAPAADAAGVGAAPEPAAQES